MHVKLKGAHHGRNDLTITAHSSPGQGTQINWRPASNQPNKKHNPLNKAMPHPLRNAKRPVERQPKSGKPARAPKRPEARRRAGGDGGAIVTQDQMDLISNILQQTAADATAEKKKAKAAPIKDISKFLAHNAHNGSKPNSADERFISDAVQSIIGEAERSGVLEEGAFQQPGKRAEQSSYYDRNVKNAQLTRSKNAANKENGATDAEQGVLTDAEIEKFANLLYEAELAQASAKEVSRATDDVKKSSHIAKKSDETTAIQDARDQSASGHHHPNQTYTTPAEPLTLSQRKRAQWASERAEMEVLRQEAAARARVAGGVGLAVAAPSKPSFDHSVPAPPAVAGTSAKQSDGTAIGSGVSATDGGGSRYVAPAAIHTQLPFGAASHPSADERFRLRQQKEKEEWLAQLAEQVEAKKKRQRPRVAVNEDHSANPSSFLSNIGESTRRPAASAARDVVDHTVPNAAPSSTLNSSTTLTKPDTAQAPAPSQTSSFAFGANMSQRAMVSAGVHGGGGVGGRIGVGVPNDIDHVELEKKRERERQYQDALKEQIAQREAEKQKRIREKQLELEEAEARARHEREELVRKADEEKERLKRREEENARQLLELKRKMDEAAEAARQEKVRARHAHQGYIGDTAATAPAPAKRTSPRDATYDHSGPSPRTVGDVGLNSSQQGYSAADVAGLNSAAAAMGASDPSPRRNLSESAVQTEIHFDPPPTVSNMNLNASQKLFSDPPLDELEASQSRATDRKAKKSVRLNTAENKVHRTTSGSRASSSGKSAGDVAVTRQTGETEEKKKKRYKKLGDRPSWGYSNQESRRAKSQSERDPNFERRQREREKKMQDRKEHFRQLQEANNRHVPGQKQGTNSTAKSSQGRRRTQQGDDSSTEQQTSPRGSDFVDARSSSPPIPQHLPPNNNQGVPLALGLDLDASSSVRGGREDGDQSGLMSPPVPTIRNTMPEYEGYDVKLQTARDEARQKKVDRQQQLTHRSSSPPVPSIYHKLNPTIAAEKLKDGGLKKTTKPPPPRQTDPAQVARNMRSERDNEREARRLQAEQLAAEISSQPYVSQHEVRPQARSDRAHAPTHEQEPPVVPFLRTEEVLDADRAQQLLPPSRERSDAVRVRLQHMERQQPAKFGLPASHTETRNPQQDHELSRKLAEQQALLQHYRELQAAAGGIPEQTDVLQSQQLYAGGRSTARQGEILRHLSELRSGLVARRRQMENASATDFFRDTGVVVDSNRP